MARHLTDDEQEAADRRFWTPTRLIEKIEFVDARLDEQTDSLRVEIDLLRRRIAQLEGRDG
jgi:hypothetical protein